MIKKLFTLLTLALLVTPLTWGKDFYLTGTFNNWAMADGAYKFTESAGDGYKIYTLTVTNLGACNFKISDGYNTKYGHTDGADGRIHHNHNGINGGNIYTRPYNDGCDFVLQSDGTTTFTFKYTDGDPYELCVERTPKLSLKFNANATNNTTSWSNLVLEDMTLNDAGWWTITKAFPANSNNSTNVQFCFVDEFGQDFGWIQDDNSWYWIDKDGLVDGALYNMKFTDGRYIMRIPGEVSLSVNSDLSKLSVTPSLAVIENSCDPSHTYTVANDLQVVYFDSDKNFAVARDLTGTTVSCPSDYVDYMTTVANDHTGAWQQYNWVKINFTTAPNAQNGFAKDCIIKGGSLKGVYADNKNYTLNSVDGTALQCVAGTPFTPNVYCPANFYSSNTQSGSEVVNGAPTANTVEYWFMTPKPMEVFTLSGALYYYTSNDDEGFYMEKKMQDATTGKWFNPAGLKGGIGFNTDFNSAENPGLTKGQSYRFLTMAKDVSGSNSKPSYGAPLRASNYSLEPEPGSTRNTNFEASALNLGKGSSIVTGVNEVKTGSDVVSVTYCDLAGRMSQKPFAGVNIIVTRYSDGTVKTTKAIK